MGIIEAKGLTRRFGARTAVDALNLDVAAGSITGFLGPNGAGKTTTIRMLLGLIHPTAGEAWVCGVPVRERRRMTARVGAIVETPAFYGALTARDNLRVLALTQGLRLSRARYDEVLDRVGLRPRANEPVQGFSLGMKQRLGVAAALLPDPRVLFLDEPTNGLDPQGQVEMRTLLASLPSEGRTVFVSSHLLRDVERICTEVVIIHQGRTLVQGPVKTLLADAAKVRARVDDAAAAVTVLRRERPRFECRLVGEQLVLPVPNGAAPDEFAADLARVLIGAGVALFELTPAREGLEQFFLELTKAEA